MSGLPAPAAAWTVAPVRSVGAPALISSVRPGADRWKRRCGPQPIDSRIHSIVAPSWRLVRDRGLDIKPGNPATASRGHAPPTMSGTIIFKAWFKSRQLGLAREAAPGHDEAKRSG